MSTRLGPRRTHRPRRHRRGERRTPAREPEEPHLGRARLIDVSTVTESAWVTLEQHRHEAPDGTGPGTGGTAAIPRTETDESP